LITFFALTFSSAWQETVSLDGTHLGHNLPDKKGNRYCINIVCVAGNPAVKSEL
jgi:peptide methionine sulfoxide reductase MsrB